MLRVAASRQSQVVCGGCNTLLMFPQVTYIRMQAAPHCVKLSRDILLNVLLCRGHRMYAVQDAVTLHLYHRQAVRNAVLLLCTLLVLTTAAC